MLQTRICELACDVHDTATHQGWRVETQTSLSIHSPMTGYGYSLHSSGQCMLSHPRVHVWRGPWPSGLKRKHHVSREHHLSPHLRKSACVMTQFQPPLILNFVAGHKQATLSARIIRLAHHERRIVTPCPQPTTRYSCGQSYRGAHARIASIAWVRAALPSTVGETMGRVMPACRYASIRSLHSSDVPNKAVLSMSCAGTSHLARP